MLLVPITRLDLDWISRIQTFQGEGFDLCFRSLVRADKLFDVGGNGQALRLCSFAKPRFKLGINRDRHGSYNRFYASAARSS